MADKRRMKGRKRKPGGQYLIDQPKKSKPTSFDNLGMSLRCLHCEEIWNGPHKGEKIKRFSAESRALMEEGQRLGYAQPGASDGVCGKRSCVEKETQFMLDGIGRDYSDQELSELARRVNEQAFEDRRTMKDKYPEGLIDDVEPPL